MFLWFSSKSKWFLTFPEMPAQGMPKAAPGLWQNPGKLALAGSLLVKWLGLSHTTHSQVVRQMFSGTYRVSRSKGWKILNITCANGAGGQSQVRAPPKAWTCPLPAISAGTRFNLVGSVVRWASEYSLGPRRCLVAEGTCRGTR